MYRSNCSRVSHNFVWSVRYVALIAVFLLLSIGSLCAQQSISGAISGTVTDSSGAAVPGAAIILTNQGTSVSRSATSDNKGFYSIEALPSGQYMVKVSREGFKEAITRDIHLDPGQRRANNVALEVGSTSSQVTVDADTVQVDTESSETGGTITEKQINNMMLNGRNFQTLAMSVPGVSSTTGSDALGGGGINGFLTLVVNGSSINYTSYTIDGVYDEYTGNLENLNVLPVVEGISEMRVLTGNYSAKYGLAGTGQILVNTKSGSDTFHGSAWDYLRNDAFDARNYFAVQNQKLRQNIFGYTMGGPVIIPKLYNTRRDKKTFFFAAGQWQLITNGGLLRGAMFPQAMRDGDFSSSPTLAGNLTLDQHSQALLASHGKTNCILGPTTLNKACFDPAAVALMNEYWPLPNNPSGGFLNFVNQGAATTVQADHQFRIDHSINSNNILTGRVMYEEVKNSYPNNSWGGNPAPTIQEALYTTGMNALIRETATITPNLVNTIGLAETYNKPRLNTVGGTMPAGITIVQAFPGADLHNRIPNISVGGGWSSNGTGALPVTASEGLTILSDDVSWIKNRHVLQAGGFYLWEVFRGNSQTKPQGSFRFNGSHTGDPAADYLLGLNSSYSQVNTDRYQNDYYRQSELYVQDDWKVTPRLAINAGLRWAYFSSDYFGNGNHITNFLASTFVPSQAPVVKLNGTLLTDNNNVPITSGGTAANPLNGLVFAGQGGIPKGFFIPVKTNFGPRIGFAYDLTGNAKNVLRGGYGIGYTREASFNGLAYGLNPPYTKSAHILNSLLSDGTAGTAAAPTAQSLGTIAWDFRADQIQSFSLTLERQITSKMMGQIGYVGNLGRRLETQGVDDNFPLPVSQPSRTDCLPSGQAPSAAYQFDPCINAGTVSPDYTRPYKGYQAFNGESNRGSSNYNSLQSSLVYRSGGSQATVAYTYGKALATIGSRTVATGYSIGSPIQNWRDYASEYGPPDYDFRHNLTVTWVYDLPYFSKGSKLVTLPLGNWSFAGMALHQSGFAVSPAISTDTNGLATRPDQIGSIRLFKKMDRWFDTSAFAAPAFGFFGNASNGTIRGPGQTSFNVALYKTFPLFDRLATQFRVEAFNVFNHPSFINVDTVYGDGNYGEVNSAHDPRILELALKINF